MKFKAIIFVWAISLVLFILLAVNVIHGTMVGWNDAVYTQIEAWINPSLTHIMIGLSNMGAWFIYVPIALLFLIIPRSRIKIGVPAASLLVISDLLNLGLKHMFAIARPDIHRLISENGYGFPSGHAMNGTVFIGICAYFFMRYSFKRAYKIAVFTLSLGFMLLMGFSRIYLGVHTPTDVLGGYLAGIFVMTSGILVILRFPKPG